MRPLGDAGRLFKVQIGQTDRRKQVVVLDQYESMPFAGTSHGGSPRTHALAKQLRRDLSHLPRRRIGNRPAEMDRSRAEYRHGFLGKSDRHIGESGPSGALSQRQSGGSCVAANLEGKGHWILSADTQNLVGPFQATEEGGQIKEELDEAVAERIERKKAKISKKKDQD